MKEKLNPEELAIKYCPGYNKGLCVYEKCKRCTYSKYNIDKKNCFIDGYNTALNNIDEDTSDGFHTFKELYEYRLLYNAAFANLYSEKYPDKVVKSLRHHDGEFCFGGGWFVVIINLPNGQISNHYELQYWDYFKCRSTENAPEWDGHTPQIAAERLKTYIENNIK